MWHLSHSTPYLLRTGSEFCSFNRICCCSQTTATIPTDSSLHIPDVKCLSFWQVIKSPAFFFCYCCCYRISLVPGLRSKTIPVLLMSNLMVNTLTCLSISERNSNPYMTLPCSLKMSPNPILQLSKQRNTDQHGHTAMAWETQPNCLLTGRQNQECSNEGWDWRWLPSHYLPLWR